MNTALLDTDFISKLHITKNGNHISLIQHFLQTSNFSFVCHEQICIELARHNGSASTWLTQEIQKETIVQYTDEKLLLLLQDAFTCQIFHHYLSALKESCDLFSASFYCSYYESLEALLETNAPACTIEKFIDALQACDSAVGCDNNLGEIKTYLTAKILYLCKNTTLYYFCSDDRKARCAVSVSAQHISIECISALALFLIAKNLLHMPKDEARIYFDSWMKLHAQSGQTKFKVYDNTPSQRLISVDGIALFENIYANRYRLRKDGMLTDITIIE
ncbi:MAG: hypothetical protein R3Y06_03180 [Faecalibacterium sp.]